MDTLTSLLQWLIPAGSLGSLLVWLTSRTLRQTRTAKEVHETYKTLYDNISQTLIELQGDNQRLYKAVSRLERAIHRSSTCRYVSHCPVRLELQEQSHRAKPHTHRQPAAARDPRDHLQTYPHESDPPGDECTDPP